MEAVKQFNQDLSSLYETKPPISKAKMTSITKGAIKAIKFYKHVVQSVEKFIQKCRPEYKIPGLYVIDSIVRQSRHQFSPEKDVFAPRFSKNIKLTFYHLYKCPDEEKSKVIRVLNLWQKNEVFQSEVIQPLFDLANPKSELTRQMEEVAKGNKPQQQAGLSQQHTPSKSNNNAGGIQVSSEFKTADSPATVNHSSGSSAADQQMTQQLQTILQLLKNHAQPSNDVKFNKKLLDFDYSDDEDAAEQQDQPQPQQPSPAMLEALQGILENKGFLNKLKSMGAITDHQIVQLQQLLPAAAQQVQQQQHQQHQQPPPQQAPPPIQMMPPGLGHPPLMQHQPPALAVPPVHSLQGHPFQQAPPLGQPQFAQAGMGGGVIQWGNQMVPSVPMPMGQPPPITVLDGGGANDQADDDDIMVVEDHSSNWRGGGGGGERRRRSRSRSRDRKRRRSRSRERDRDRDRGSRSRRRSRSREDRRDREEDRQKQKEREKKGLPPIKKGHLSVCSTTLWVGHMSKLVAEDELSDLFGEMGVVNTINVIPPRGCAYVCMNRRMDASRALRKLHKHKLHGKPITLAWAPGKGMKDKMWRDYWDVDYGVSYIPIDKLDPQVNMVELEEGGVFDDDTMPEWMKTMRGVAPDSQSPATAAAAGAHAAANVAAAAMAAQFIPVPDGIPPPNSLGAPTATSVSGIPVPTSAGPPPGIPPFGIPPPGGPPPAAAAAAAAVAGLLPPGPPPNLLAGQPGILPPGGAGLIGAAPPNLLLGAPLGQPPAGPGLIGAPPTLPGFDASQPPPGQAGLRLAFPPPGGAPGIPPRLPPPLVPDGPNKPPLMGDAPPSIMDPVPMKEDGPDTQPPPRRRERGEKRGSRWGSEKPEAPPDEQRRLEADPGMAPGGGGDLAARLRSLAGMAEPPQSDRPKPEDPPLFDQPPEKQGDGPPLFVRRGPFDDGGGDAGARPPPFGGPPGGDRGVRPPLFDGPPHEGFGALMRGPRPPFIDGGGPPPPFDGPPRFDGPPFMRGPGPRFGGAPPPFGDGGAPPRMPFGDFGRGGGRGGDWRGRGGRFARGGGPPPFMDRPAPFGDGLGGGPPFGDNFDNDFNNDRPPWEGGGGRGRGGGPGGRGGFNRDLNGSSAEGDERDQRRLPGLFDNFQRPFGEPNENEGGNPSDRSQTPDQETPGEEKDPATAAESVEQLQENDDTANMEDQQREEVNEESVPPAQPPKDAGFSAANLVGSLYEDDDEEEEENVNSDHPQPTEESGADGVQLGDEGAPETNPDERDGTPEEVGVSVSEERLETAAPISATSDEQQYEQNRADLAPNPAGEQEPEAEPSAQDLSWQEQNESARAEEEPEQIQQQSQVEVAEEPIHPAGGTISETEKAVVVDVGAEDDGTENSAAAPLNGLQEEEAPATEEEA